MKWQYSITEHPVLARHWLGQAIIDSHGACSKPLKLKVNEQKGLSAKLAGLARGFASDWRDIVKKGMVAIQTGSTAVLLKPDQVPGFSSLEALGAQDRSFRYRVLVEFVYLGLKFVGQGGLDRWLRKHPDLALAVQMGAPVLAKTGSFFIGGMGFASMDLGYELAGAFDQSQDAVHELIEPEARPSMDRGKATKAGAPAKPTAITIQPKPAHLAKNPTRESGLLAAEFLDPAQLAMPGESPFIHAALFQVTPLRLGWNDRSKQMCVFRAYKKSTLGTVDLTTAEWQQLGSKAATVVDKANLAAWYSTVLLDPNKGYHKGGEVYYLREKEKLTRLEPKPGNTHLCPEAYVNPEDYALWKLLPVT